MFVVSSIYQHCYRPNEPLIKSNTGTLHYASLVIFLFFLNSIYSARLTYRSALNVFIDDFVHVPIDFVYYLSRFNVC